MLLCACSGGAEPEAPRASADLLDVAAFVPADVDPMGHGRVDGPPVGWTLEGVTLEIDTGACHLAVFEQPLLADVRPDDVLELVFWHNQLVAEEPAEAHFALLVEDEVVYERFVPIPSDPLAYTDRFDGVTAAPGDRLQLHLHNHGANTWNLLHLERQGAE